MAPGVQALSSFTLSLVAVRALGPEGLGTFALLYAGIVLATAVTTGMVGDSLTVLDRGSATIRGGLLLVGLLCVAVAGTLGFALALGAGLISIGEAALFALALSVFLVEDLVRRLLMACLRFWSVVAVDVSAFVTAVLWLAGRYLTVGSLGMADLLTALLVAQVVGLGVGVVLLPRSERWLAALSWSGTRVVVRFGRWRSAQQAIRPASLAMVRVVVVAAAGLSVFGQLEAARVFTAPAVLIVQGASSFLFASFAANPHVTLTSRLRRADRAVVGVVAVASLLGAAAVALVPFAGDLITGGEFDLDSAAVLSWSLYAAAAALVTPYASLAAVSGHHVRLFLIRATEAVVAVGLVWVVVGPLQVSAAWAPSVLAAGSVVSALLVRWMLVRSTPLPRDSSDVVVEHLNV